MLESVRRHHHSWIPWKVSTFHQIPAFHSLNEGSICLCIFAFLNIHYVWKPLIWHDTCCWLERCRWQGLNVNFSRLFWRSRLPSFSFYASPPLLLLLFGDFFLFLESLAMQLSDFSHLEENAVCNIKWKGLMGTEDDLNDLFFTVKTVKWNEDTEPFAKIKSHLNDGFLWLHTMILTMH